MLTEQIRATPEGFHARRLNGENPREVAFAEE